MRSSLRLHRGACLLLAIASLSACSEADSQPAEHQVTGVWVEFDEPATGFVTAEVYDSDREVVQFDSIAHLMVDADGNSVAGWTATGNDLAWDRNTIAFRVLFGSEAGERRAYFTEAATGTICNLRIDGPDDLAISSTSEVPPQEPEGSPSD